jgi:hypothetical protein
MIGCLVHEKYETIPKEAIKVLARNFSGGTEQNHELPVRIASVTAWIRTENLTYTIPEFYRYINRLIQKYEGRI